MYLPTTYVAALLLTIVSMICWGSWANTQKLSGKWRFELFYFDYAFGVLLCTLIAFFTLGSMNSAEITAMDTFALTGKMKMLYAFAGGVVFNLANILLVAAIAVAGLAVAFPVGIGLAMIIGVCWNYRINPQGNPILLFTGAAIVLAAIVVDAVAYRLHSAARPASQPKPPPTVTGPSRSRAAVAAPPKPGAAKGIIISIVSGVLMGSFYPLVELGRAGDDGLRPYMDILIFTLGLFSSTFIFVFFFMLLPVQGEPVEPIQYFRGTRRQHLLGLAGGAIWCVGAIANFIASSAPKDVQVGPATSYALGQGATMVSALWGLLVWHEFAGATPKVRALLTAMLILFLAGLGLVSIAPLYPRA